MDSSPGCAELVWRCDCEYCVRHRHVLVVFLDIKFEYRICVQGWMCRVVPSVLKCDSYSRLTGEVKYRRNLQQTASKPHFDQQPLQPLRPSWAKYGLLHLWLSVQHHWGSIGRWTHNGMSISSENSECKFIHYVLALSYVDANVCFFSPQRYVAPIVFLLLFPRLIYSINIIC